MFGLGSFLFAAMASLIVACMPIIVIALIVAFIVRQTSGKKTEYGYVKPGEVLMDDVPQQHSNSTAMNILLYAGSFFIIGSIFLIIKDQPSLMPVMTILVTLLAYSAGLLLYKFVDYLRPVAIAFTYTAAAIFPLWFYAFTEIGLPGEAAMLLSTTISLVSYIFASVILESRILGWLSYLWMIFFGWSIANTIDSSIHDNKVLTYTFFIWPCVIALFANALWANRVKWLPISFRKATQVLAEGLAPLFLILVTSTLFIPNMGENYPLLRTIVALLAACNALLSWGKTKSRGHLVALRICVQAFIIFIFADASNYSLLDKNSSSTDLMMTLAWLISFLAQTLISLFVKVRNESEARSERAMLIFSLAGVLSTSLFCLHFEPTERAITLISIASVVAALGILIAWRFKNLNWGIATIIGIAAIPLILGLDIAKPIWSGWVFFFIYAILTLIYICIYGLLKMLDIQPKQSFNLAIAALVCGNYIAITAITGENWASVGLLNLALDFALIALIARKFALLEASVYCAAVALAEIIREAVPDANYGLKMLEANIVSLPILGFGFYKERKQSSGARLIIGYILFVLLMLAASPDSYKDTQGKNIWALVFILENVALIFAGAITRRKWLAVSSTVVAVLAILDLTDGLNAVWLLLIGVGMIAFVAWQLVKSNSKKGPGPDAGITPESMPPQIPQQ